MLKKLLDYLVLPETISDFERGYLARVNKIGFTFFLLHPPVFMAVAALAGTGVFSALWMSAVVLAGPFVAMKRMENPRHVSIVHGVTAMLMGALLVHFGQGQVQIEMHFYFFVLLALLAVTANPMVVTIAAVTAAVHHTLFYFLLPQSVFNYDAQVWVVGIHALFVVVESVAAIYVARSFFDNVIGLEKKVAARTADMRLLLDNVDQGFLTLDQDGIIADERSAVVDRWFGAVKGGDRWTDYIGRVSEDTATWFELAWESLQDGFMPVEVSLDQLPKKLEHEDRHYAFEYKPLFLPGGEELDKLLIMVHDVTADVEREQAEAVQREMMIVVDRILRDRGGFLEFFQEASALIDRITVERDDVVLTKRHIHTLKGNCALFGLKSISGLCHVLEQQMIEEDRNLTETERRMLSRDWSELSSRLAHIIGDRPPAFEIEEDEVDELFGALVRRVSRRELAEMMVRWKGEPMTKRLPCLAERAQRLAQRLGKGDINVEVEPGDIRLPREVWSKFWSAFVHVIRNAVDHGLETPDDRLAAGKSEVGTLTLATYVEEKDFVIEVADDGKGINWDAVADKARSQGMPCDVRDDLIAALLSDGVSTAERVTDTSGRGVGMAAIAAACADQGGFVTVESEPGQGTSWQFRFPREVAELSADLSPWGVRRLSELKFTQPPTVQAV